MTALTTDRNTPRAQGDIDVLAVGANVKIYGGALVCRNATGFAVPGATATGLKGAGVAEERVDNTGGSAGDKTIQVRRGRFRFANSASTDEITRADVGSTCYVVDDQTVAKTNGTNTRSSAGTVVGVDDAGVWVRLDY